MGPDGWTGSAPGPTTSIHRADHFESSGLTASSHRTCPGVRGGRAQTATYVTGSLPGTASAWPSFTRRRRWASASETAMFLDP